MKRWQVWALAGVVAAALQTFFCVGLGRRDAAPPAAHWTAIFPMSIHEFQDVVPATGRPAVLYFWATWCEPCVRHLPESLALAEALADEVDVWLVARDSTPQAVARYFKGRVPARVVHDKGGRLGDALGLDLLPTSFFVTADGLVTARTLDDLDASTLSTMANR